MNLEELSWVKSDKGCMREGFIVKIQIEGEEFSIFPVFHDSESLDPKKTAIYRNGNGEIYEMTKGKEYFIERYSKKIVEETGWV